MTAGEAGLPGGAGAHEPLGPPELLGEVRALRRRARAVRHAYWFPLVLFGVLTCASIPFYLRSANQSGSGVFGTVTGGPALPVLGGSGPLVQGDLGYYWIAALLGGLLLTLLWYSWHARRVGLQTPARGYLIAGAVLAGLAIVIPPLSAVRSPHWLRFLGLLRVAWPGDLMTRGTFPFVLIAVGLVVLAWAERSRALAATAVIYMAVSLVASLYDVSNLTARLGWNLAAGDSALPNVLLPGLVLLVAGAVAYVVQLRSRGHA